MTIKELYELAKATNHENATIRVQYYCGASWYDLGESIDFSNITLGDKEIIIKIDGLSRFNV